MQSEIKIYKEEIKIYIENYVSKTGGDVAEYTIDFHGVENAERFFQNTFPEVEYNSGKFYNLRVPYSGRHRMFPGSWYSIPVNLFQRAEYEAINEESEGGGGYAGIIKVKDRISDFSQYLTSINLEAYDVYKYMEINFRSSIETMVVVNCGQGNWNEIHSESEVLIYDMGASSRYTGPQIKCLVNNRFSEFKEKSVGVVISHWDMDHFQSLLHLESNHLSNISYICGPSNIPASNVYMSTIEHLTSNRVNFQLIAPTYARSGRSIALNQLSSSRTVDVYRSVSGSSRNQTGIVLAIKGEGKVALLTGDHHYEKIYDAIKTKYTNRDIILVAPHHGGRAGSLDITCWEAEFNSVECPISVGDNSYNHPSQNIKNLESLQKSVPRRTDNFGDVVFGI